MKPIVPSTESPMLGLTVLVVEDSGVQRDHAASLAKSMGAARVLETADGREGLAVLAAEPRVDLVLSDLEMPRMDGISFIGEVADRGYRPRVIIISSQEVEVLRTVRLMAETCGLAVSGVIPKPLEPEVLAGLLTTAPGACPRQKPQQETHGILGGDEIRRGIAADEFLCFYQPQITLKGALLRGAEALVRWRHPHFGLLGPSAFLPQAEMEEELISALTLSVLAKVALQWHAWSRRGIHLEVSVNLSARSLGQSGFADRLLDATQRLELPPKSVVFEVTESASVAHLGHSLANFARLRMQGFKLSIDDFGTGFATFEQLQRIPFTELKIDKSITRMLPGEERQMLMVRRMIQMAQDLKLVAVAEGIETLESWQALQKLDCDLAQGYFIARPMPGEQLHEWARVDRAHLH